MKDVWNLEPLYRSFEDPAFEEDVSRLTRCLEDFEAFTREPAAGENASRLSRGLELMEQVTQLVEKLVTYALLRQTADTRDPAVSSQLGRLMNLASASAAPEAAFKGWICSLENLTQLVQTHPELQHYRFLLESIQDSGRYLLPDIGEKIVAKLQLSGSNAWAELQQ